MSESCPVNLVILERATRAPVLNFRMVAEQGGVTLHGSSPEIGYAKMRMQSLEVRYALVIEDPTPLSRVRIELTYWGLTGGLNEVYGPAFTVNPENGLQGAQTFPAIRTDDVIEGERCCDVTFSVKANCRVVGQIEVFTRAEVVEDRFVPTIGARPITFEEQRILAALRRLLDDPPG